MVRGGFFPFRSQRPALPEMPESQSGLSPSQQVSGPSQAPGLLQIEQQEGSWVQVVLTWLEPQVRWEQAQPPVPVEGVTHGRGGAIQTELPVPGEQGQRFE